MDADKLIATLEQNGEMQQEIIHTQQEMIAVLTENNQRLRNELAELRERVEKHELIYLQPFDFLLWKLFHQVWPFSLLFGRE